MPPAPGASQAPASASLFELPGKGSGGGGRAARIVTVLALDAVLAGAGIAMIVAYLNAREAAARPVGAAVEGAGAPDAGRPVVDGEIEVQKVRVVGKGADAGPGGVTGGAGAAVKKPGGEAPPGKKPGGPGAAGGGAAGGADAGSPLVEVIAPQIADAGVPGGGGQVGSNIGGLGQGPPDAAPEPVGTPPEALVDAGEAAPPGEPTLSEQQLAEKVQETVTARMGQVRRCWENAAKASAEENVPQGTVEIEFAVQSNGAASDVKVVSNSTGSPELGDCVAAVVGTFRFPAHGGEPVVFVWPFVFRSAAR